jgi:hypothetical protein
VIAASISIDGADLVNLTVTGNVARAGWQVRLGNITDSSVHLYISAAEAHELVRTFAALADELDRRERAS